MYSRTWNARSLSYIQQYVDLFMIVTIRGHRAQEVCS